MANNNLPSAWGNRNPSAKPDWGNQKKESPIQEETVTLISNEDKITDTSSESKEPIADVQKDEILNDTTLNIADSKIQQVIENNTEKIKAIETPNTTADSSITKPHTKAPQKNSNVAVVVLSLTLTLVIIALIVFVILYFSKQKKDNNSNSNTTTTIVESEQNTTNTTQSTTSTQASPTQVTTDATTEATTTNSETDNYDYTGFWHPEGDGETELTIHSMDSSTVTFSLWYYRIYSAESLTATFDGGSAYFSNNEIEGYLTFYDGEYICLNITMSTVTGVPSYIDQIFDTRIDESAQHGNGMSYFTSFEPYTLQIQNPYLYIYDTPSYNGNVVGEITDKGKYTIVEEYYEYEQASIECTWGKLKSGEGWINLYEATLTDTSSEDDIPTNEDADNTGDIVYDSSVNWLDYNGLWSSSKAIHYHGDKICYDIVLSLELYEDNSMYCKIEMCNGNALYEVSQGKLYPDGDGTYSGSDYAELYIIELGIYNDNIHLIITNAYNIWDFGDAVLDLKIE